MNKYKIAQVGTFDVENYGDLLFPTILEAKLRERLEIDSFMIFSPIGGKKPFDEEVTVFPIDSLEQMHLEQGFDAIIIGGGDLIRLDKDVSPTYSHDFRAASLIWQEPILVANRYNIPIIFNAPGVPFSFENKYKKIVNKLVNLVDFCSVRDEKSKKILEACGVESVLVSPDSIISIHTVFEKKKLVENCKLIMENGKVSESKGYFVIQHNTFNINNELYIDKINELIKHILSNTDQDILLVPIGYVHSDILFLEKLNHEQDRVHLVKEKLSPYDMLSVFANCSGFIGTSLHGLVTTSAYNVPIMCLNELKLVKIHGFLELIGKESIEVNAIQDAKYIFDNEFIHPYNSRVEKTRKRVEDNFDTICRVIESKKIKHKVESLEIDLLNNLYSENELLIDMQSSFENINLYYTIEEGDSYNDINCEKVKVEQVGQRIEFNKEMSNIRELRIDLIEGFYIKIRNLLVEINGNTVDPKFSNAYKYNGYEYFLTTDPQLLFDVRSEGERINIKMSCEMTKVTYKDLDGVFNSYRSELMLLQDKNEGLSHELIRIKRPFLRKVIDRIRKK